MAGRGLEERLVGSGALRREAVQMARRRQKVYGGGLDTVLLEMGLVDEGTLWALLAEDSGLAPLPPHLLDGPVAEPEVLLGYTEARRLGAFAFEPDGDDKESAQVVVRPGFDGEALASVLGGRPAEVFIVPEVRFEALLGAFYAQSIPPRFVSLLGRMMGAEQLRRWAATRSPRRHLQLPLPPVDVGPRPLHQAENPAPLAGPPPQDLLAPVIAEAVLPPTAAIVVHEQAPLDGRQNGGVAEPKPETEDPTTAAEAHERSDQTDLSATAPVTTTMAMLESLPRDNADRSDVLLAALTWHADLDGGPRAEAVARAITTHWSGADVFARLVHLARRGEHVARTALPLLASRANMELLSSQLRAPTPRHRVWAAQTLKLCLRGNFLDVAALEQTTTLLCQRMEGDPDPDVRAAAAQALRGMAARPALQPVLNRISSLVADASALDPGRLGAALLLSELRADVPAAIVGLIAGCGAKSQAVAESCHAALVRITGHEPGRGRAAWRRWWKKNSGGGRAAWLVAALEARRPELRLAASNELAELAGQTLGYHFDLTASQRRAAVGRWQEWLKQQRP